MKKLPNRIKRLANRIRKVFLEHEKLSEFCASLLLSVITYSLGNVLGENIDIDPNIYNFLLILTTLFVFLVTEITLYILFHEDHIVKKISEIRVDTENIMDPNMTAFLEFLAEECYGRCSKYNKNCKHCELYNTAKCNGLLRNYIYEDCLKLAESISKSNQGQYFLNTNIEEYHVIAIQQLMDLECEQYCVIQRVKDRTEELYDSLDFHFLFSLIEKVTAKSNPTADNYVISHNFKIKWIFVGDPQYIKNNYDYIFFVFSKFDDNLGIKDFFEFYTISNDDFLAKRQGVNKIGHFISSDEPSIGIFGDKFIFVDSPYANFEHGNIYTSHYKNVKDIFVFFEELLKLSNKCDFLDLKQKYEDLLNDTTLNNHKETLQKRWTRN